MPKVKEIKTKKPSSRAKVTIKSLMTDVRKEMNKKKIKKIMNFLSHRQEELDNAKIVVRKLEAQIKKIENMDINEIDLDDFEAYNDEEEY